MDLSPLERRFLQSADQPAVTVPAAELGPLLGNVAYHPSLGDPPSARHYRRSLDDGSCLHLVIENETAMLHIDRYDPHQGPASLLAHLSEESPQQAFSLIVAVVALLRRIAY